MVGLLSQRVLGQYDLALLSAEHTPGKLLFVEENIRQTARSLGVPLGPFRTWIALHETTHAFEFEAHPWLRPYLAERLERQMALVGGDVRQMGREALKGLGRALRGEDDGGGHWLERMMGEEQRRLSSAATETLAIIAYHEPVSRAEIEAIRGVQISKGTLDVLMDAGWVRPAGRREGPGRPLLYATTQDFLTHFGLGSRRDLPGIDDLKAAGLLDPLDDSAFQLQLESEEEGD